MMKLWAKKWAKVLAKEWANEWVKVLVKAQEKAREKAQEKAQEKVREKAREKAKVLVFYLYFAQLEQVFLLVRIIRFSCFVEFLWGTSLTWHLALRQWVIWI